MTVRSSGSITPSHEYMFEGSMHRIELRGNEYVNTQLNTGESWDGVIDDLPKAVLNQLIADGVIHLAV